MEALPKLTLKALLDQSVERFLDRPALSFVNDEPLTYLELHQQVQSLVQFLQKQGILNGDRVAILGENMPNWGIAFFAVTTMGAVAVPILPDFHPNEIHHILRHSGSKAIFISERLYAKLEDGQFDELSIRILLDDFRLIPLTTKKEMLKEFFKEGSKEFTRLKDAAFGKTGRTPFKMPENDVLTALSSAGTPGAKFQKQVQELAQMLDQHEVNAGDRVAILSRETPQWQIVLCAITALRALLVPILPDFQPADIAQILRQTNCKAILVSEACYPLIANQSFEQVSVVIALEDFRPLPLETRQHKLKELLEASSHAFQILEEKFTQIKAEDAEDQFQQLLQQGNSALEQLQDDFPPTPATPIRNRFKEFIEDSQKELEKLKKDFPFFKTDLARDKFREMLHHGEKELEKLKDAAIRMTSRVPADIQEDDLVSIIYTSGTTGNSKGVMLTHKNIVADALSAYELVNYTTPGQERFISVLPLSHTYECTIGFIIPMMIGSCVYYLEKPPTASVLLPAMAKIRPTMMLTVPLIIEKIYKAKILPQLTHNAILRTLYKLPLARKWLHKFAGKKLYASFGGCVHFFGIGGAPLSPDVELFLRDAGFPYAIGYGLTETSPLIAGSNAQFTKYRSTGPAIRDVEIRIDQPNPQTGEGEIFVRGPNVMRGYYKAPSVTAEAFTSDGWLKTGDLGVLTDDGYLYIKGRLKNMILGPSGENIYPEEIEAVLNESDYVVESLVFQQQEQLVARVHLDYEKIDARLHREKPGETDTQQKIQALLEELRQSVNARVSAFSRLKKIIEQPEPFEKTPTKKIKRYLYVN